MKILLVLLLLLLLLLAVYPVRAAAEFADWRLRVYWLPLFGLPWRVKLLEKDFTPSEDTLTALIQGDIIDWNKLRDKDKKTKPKPRVQADWRRLAAAIPAALHIRQFRLAARLGGDPAATALLAGAGWSALAAALGWLSFNVAAWPKDAPVAVDLLPPPAELKHSQIEFQAEGWLMAGVVLPRVAGAWLGGRRKRRLAESVR